MPALTDADLELLSAYLDDELPAGQRAAVERRLSEDPDLRAELDDLRRVAALVRASAVRAPRDFRLDPAVYGRRAAPAYVPRRAYVYRLASAASALAAVLLLVVAGLSVFTRSPGVLAPAANFAAPQAEQDESQASAPRTPVALAPTATRTLSLPSLTQTAANGAVMADDLGRTAPTATTMLFQANEPLLAVTPTFPPLPTMTQAQADYPETAQQPPSSAGAVGQAAQPTGAIPPGQPQETAGEEFAAGGEVPVPSPLPPNAGMLAVVPSPSPASDLGQAPAGGPGQAPAAPLTDIPVQEEQAETESAAAMDAVSTQGDQAQPSPPAPLPLATQGTGPQGEGASAAAPQGAWEGSPSPLAPQGEGGMSPTAGLQPPMTASPAPGVVFQAAITTATPAPSSTPPPTARPSLTMTATPLLPPGTPVPTPEALERHDESPGSAVSIEPGILAGLAMALLAMAVLFWVRGGRK